MKEEMLCEVSMADVVQPRRQKVLPADYADEPYIGLEHIEPHTMKLVGVGRAADMSSSANRFFKGDVLYSRLRPYLNKVFEADRNGLCSAEFIVFPSSSYINSTFLKYRLNAADFVEFANSLNAGDRPRVDFDQISAFKFLLPSSLAQAKLVQKLEELLSDLDAGVAELKAAQHKLKQYRQSLLKAAVEGALTAEWREERKREELRRQKEDGRKQKMDSDFLPSSFDASSLLDRILTERRARWEAKQLAKFQQQGKAPPKDWQKKYPEPVQPDTSGLPDLPQGWVWASVDQVVSESLLGLDRGQKLQSKTVGNVSYVKMNNLSMNGDIEIEGLVRIDATDTEIERYQLRVDDILFNTRNSKELVGKIGRISRITGSTVFNNNLMRLRFDGASVPVFACYQMVGPEFRSRMERIKKATTSVAAVYAKDFFPMAFVLPPHAEQIEIVVILEQALAGIADMEQTIARQFKQSAAQRQNILRAAFAGQLVPQDPNDEPASVLLARIRAEHAARDTLKMPCRRKAKESV